MATKIVKGSRDFSADIAAKSAAMSNAWMLYPQDRLDQAPANQTYYMSKWQYFEGGTYIVKMMSDDGGTVYVDSEVAVTATIVEGVKSGPQILISNGWHRLDASYYNLPANTPGYIGFAFYRDGNVGAEVISSPDGIFGDDYTWPDIGTKPSGGNSTLSLPVFLPRPNWADSVTETFAFLTTVVTSESGGEQRRKIRRFPRRYVEAQFRGLDNRRQVMDLAVAALGKDPVLIPLWFDTQFIKEAYEEGTTVISGDFKYRNFHNGCIAIVRGASVFDYELLPVLSVTDTKITLARGLLKSWQNFQLLPCRQAVVDEQVSATNYMSKAADYQIRFRCVDAESFIQPSWAFDGEVFPRNGITDLPIINLRPNWRENITHAFDRVIFQTDNQTGVPYVMDAGNQETMDWSLPLQLRGTHQYYSFLELIYAMAGQQMPFHAPNWMEDMTLVQDIDASSGFLAVQRTGYSYYSALTQDIRRWIYLETNDGTVYENRIVSSRAENDTEYLYLDQTIGNIAKSNVRVLCFMPYCRLGSDTVEIQHLTDLTGACEVMLALHGFIERRDGTPANI